MPYITERGVTIYYDRDTPEEYATGQDEDAARFNEARDRAMATAEQIATDLDPLWDSPQPDQCREMAAIADALDALRARIRAACYHSSAEA